MTVHLHLDDGLPTGLDYDGVIPVTEYDHTLLTAGIVHPLALEFQQEQHYETPPTIKRGIVSLVRIKDNRAVAVLFGGRAPEWRYYLAPVPVHEEALPAVHGLWVARNYRRQGIGTELIDAFLQLPTSYDMPPWKADEIAFAAPVSKEGMRLFTRLVPIEHLRVSTRAMYPKFTPSQETPANVLRWLVQTTGETR